LTITIKLSTHPATAAEARASAASLGVEVSPAHPGTRDLELASWYVGTSAGDERAAAEALRAVPGVEAAYVKPDAEPA
jgi:hypothetical protein